MKINKISRLKFKATLLKNGEVILPNGNIIDGWNKVKDFYFDYYSNTISETVAMLSTTEFNISIVARHDPAFMEDVGNEGVKIGNSSYRVASVSPDYDLNGMDRIDLKKVKKLA